MYLLWYYPFINHVIEFVFSMEWSLKLYAIMKFKYFSFQFDLYFKMEIFFVFIIGKTWSLKFNIVIWTKL